MKFLSIILFIFSIHSTVFATEMVILKGYTHSIKKAIITPEVSGKIIEINYDIGDITGEKPLIEIDNTFIDLDINHINLQLDKIKTQISKIDSRISYLKQELDRKNSLYLVEKAAEKLAPCINCLKKKSNHNNSLYFKEESLEKANSRVSYLKKELNSKDSLHLEEESSEVVYNAAQQEYDQVLLEKESLILEDKSLQIQQEQLIEKQKRYSIEVPSGWTVTAKYVEINEVIQPGKAIMQISNFQTIVVPLAVSTVELNNIRNNRYDLNGTVENIHVKSTLKYINPEFNEKTKKTDIEILIDDYKDTKRAGLLYELPLDIPAEDMEYRYNYLTLHIKDKLKFVKE